MFFDRLRCWALRRLGGVPLSHLEAARRDVENSDEMARISRERAARLERAITRAVSELSN